MAVDQSRSITLADVGREPFRIFFAEGVVAGIVGVGLWPLHFGGIVKFYPGQAHARIMAYGLFGAFIFGFLGTAMPRMLSAPGLGHRNVLLLFALHVSTVAAYATQKIVWGDRLFLVLLCTFIFLMLKRLRYRQDTPPPGFVLVGLAFLCVTAGAALSVFQPGEEEGAAYWVSLQRLLSYQGFVLLPILGIGPFLLPRFFGMPSPHDFPEMRRPNRAWVRKASLALAAGGLIVASFFIELKGWFRTAYAIRFATTAAYMALEFPISRAPGFRNALGASLRIALVAVVSGFLCIALFPGFRVSLLHLTLIGGFAVLTFTVATRVVFGHSGYSQRLQEPNRWLLVAVGLLLLGMATRMSGDFWPEVLVSHYVFGAIIWIGGVVVWAVKVLPKVLRVESE